MCFLCGDSFIILLLIQFEIIHVDSLNLIPHLLEQSALERFSEIICDHFSGRHVFDVDFPVLDLVGDEEISNVNKSSSLFTL